MLQLEKYEKYLPNFAAVSCQGWTGHSPLFTIDEEAHSYMSCTNFYFHSTNTSLLVQYKVSVFWRHLYSVGENMRKCLQSKIKIRIIKYRIFAVSCTILLDIEFIFSSSQWCSCWWCWWQRDLWQSRGWSYSWGWQTAATIESNHIILTLNTGHQHPTSSCINQHISRYIRETSSWNKWCS